MQKKRKFIDIFMFDLLFLLFVFILVYLGMTFLTPEMSKIQQYFSQTPDPSSPSFAEEFGSMSSLANWLYALLYFIIPLIIYIGYCVFEGLSFRKEWKYVIRFSLISVIPFFFLVIAATQFFMNVAVDIAGFVFFYLAFLLYLNPDFKKFGSRIWDWRLFLNYLGYAALIMILASVVVVMYVAMQVSILWISLIPVAVGIVTLISLLKKRLCESIC